MSTPLNETFLRLGGDPAVTGGTSTGNSVRINDDDSPRLFRDQTSGTGKKQTIGGWFKLGTELATTRRLIAVGSGTPELHVWLDGNDQIRVAITNDSGITRLDTNTEMRFRDPHAWYHLCVSYDTTLSSPTFKLFINNEEATLAAAHSVAQNDEFGLNSNADNITLGAISPTGTNFFDGYLSQWFCLDGTTVATPAEGDIVEIDNNGVVKPIDLTDLDFGDQGWLLDFANPGALGANAAASAFNFIPAAADYTFSSINITIGSGTIDNIGAGGTNCRLLNSFSGDFKFQATATGIAGTIFGVFDADELSIWTSGGVGHDDGKLDSMTNSWWYDDGGDGSGEAAAVGNGHIMYRGSSQTTSPISAGSVITIERAGSVIKITADGTDVHIFSQEFDNPIYVLVGNRNVTGKDLDYDNVTMTGSSVLFATTGLEPNDQVSDSPTNNWATLSSVSGVMGAGRVTLSNGNLDTEGTISTSSNNTICSHTVTAGKWIWAVKPGSPGQAQNSDPWIFDLSSGENIYVNQPNLSVAGWGSSMDTPSTFVTYHDGGNRTHPVNPIFAANDLHLIAADIDNLKVWFGYYDHNAGTTNWMDGSTGIAGDPEAGTDETWTLTGTHFAFGTSTYGTRTAQVDFGQRTGIIDKIAIPEGFEFLNTANLSAVATGIGNVDDGFIQVIATETNIVTTLEAAHSFTNYVEVFVNTSAGGEDTIIKFSDDPTNHMIWTGVGNGSFQTSPASASFPTLSGSDSWTGYAFNVDATYGMFTDSVSHTNGTDTNTAHSLGSGVKMAIVKREDAAGDWYVAHPSLTSGFNFGFDNQPEQSSPVYAAIDGTNITVNSSAPSGTYRVWAVEAIVGFSDLSVIKGNGVVDGSLPLLSVSPVWWVQKYRDTNVGGNWWTVDNIRETYNPRDLEITLDLNATGEDGDQGAIMGDMGSNFFKYRSGGGENSGSTNSNGRDICYWAIGSPFGGSNVSPATAR